MKKHIKHTILIIFTLFCSLNTNAQDYILTKSIYFETGKFDLKPKSKIILSEIADSLLILSNYNIYISGFSDNIGDSILNTKLSENRVLTTQSFLISYGIDSSLFTTHFFGENNPKSSNNTEIGKQNNRRVDISIYYVKQASIDSSKLLSSITELYQKTERKPQEFCINPTKDTVLNCEKGTIVYIKANSFRVSRSCKTKCVTIKIKEDFLKSEMILDNLSTTSNGKIIETQGMVYTEAKDCNEKKLKLSKGKDIIIMIPTDKVISEAKIFKGNQNSHNNIMNWTVNNNSVLQSFSLEQLNICNEWLCGGSYRCRFFFCKIRRFVNNILKKKSTNVRIENSLSKEMLPKCETLKVLYNDYDVLNMTDLINAINKPLLDSFQVNTVTELKDTLRQVNLSKVELSYLNKSLNYEDFKYYVYNTSKLGWSNVDVFVDIPKKQMVTMKINQSVQKNIDCKIVFKDRRFVIPANVENSKYEFKNIPKGEKVWLIVIKYDNGKPFLFIKETTVSSKKCNIKFESLTLEKLKKKLSILDV